MNDLENRFYKELLAVNNDSENELCLSHKITPQVVIGLYRVDFLVDDEFVIEIDGYEFHKTKEQRESDYQRERYLMRHGYMVIRFTGTEIFLSCKDRALEAAQIIDDILMKRDMKQMNASMEYHDAMARFEEAKNGKAEKADG